MVNYIYLSKITKFSVLLNACVSSNNQYDSFFLSCLFSYVNLFVDNISKLILYLVFCILTIKNYMYTNELPRNPNQLYERSNE